MEYGEDIMISLNINGETHGGDAAALGNS